MKIYAGTLAVAALFTYPASAATDLTSAMVTGPSGTVWNTMVDSFYTLFLQRPIGTLLNSTDNFAGIATTDGPNNFLIAGEGFRLGETENSDIFYTLTLMFADGATISGNYVGSTFTGGTSATRSGTLYTLTGFGWDRSNGDNVSSYRAESGGDPNDYTGQFRYTAVDAVGVVPEPLTWMVLLAGFDAIGAAMRTRAGRPAPACSAIGFA